MNGDLNEVVFYILIVDDNKDDFYFLKKAIDLVLPKAIVELVSHAEEVIDFLATCSALPNIIFMDMKMPRLSGREAVKRIRLNNNLKTIPIIVLSGASSETDIEELLKSGADYFYTKPMEPVNLIPIVKEVKEKWLLPSIG